MKKKETIQIRVDEDLKDRFYSAAEVQGLPPSEYLRQLMEYASSRENPFSPDDKIDALHQGLLSVIQVLYKTAYKSKDDSLFNSLMDSDIFEFYKEFTFEIANHSAKGHRESSARIVDNYLYKKLDLADITEGNPKYKHSYPDKDAFIEVRKKHHK